MGSCVFGLGDSGSENEDWEQVNGVGGVEKRRKGILLCEISTWPDWR